MKYQEIHPEEAERQKDRFRGIDTDMSPAAIARRIHLAGEMNRLARKLFQAGRMSRGEGPETLDSFILRVAERPSE